VSYNVHQHVRDAVEAIVGIPLQEVEAAAYATKRAIRDGSKLLIAGNGGSAADSQHLAAEFVNRLTKDRRSIPAIALTTDSSTMTAIANDSSFDRVFSRQIEALGKEGDVFLGISTSGYSANIVLALKTAKNMGLITIVFTGENETSAMCGLPDYCVHVPSRNTMHIQEAHLVIEHIFAAMVESELEGW
jgi:D-sedoheptulose 7-phosphate isomerase